MTNRAVVLLTCVILVAIAAQSASVPVTFTQLTGVTGGTPAETGVFAADLSGVALTSILSLTITDNSAGLGGSPGQFSGFDLDAIRLSNTSCADAACVAALPGLPVFDFSTGVVFTPGVQRAPADPKLFGTDAAGTAVDNAVATLGSFDANSTTGATAAGFISMGDGGVLSLNLTAPVLPAGLFLYIGEVGNNGEVAAGQIVVRDTPVPQVPEPSALLLLGSGLAAVVIRVRMKQA